MCTAQLMVILDATIVNVALPEAQRSLGFDTADRQWVITAYALAFGSLLLIGGRIADLIGRRRAILIGLVGFGLASALGGAAADFPMLVVARALQGAFGALLAPAALAVISTTFTEEKERGRAFGIYGGVSAGGGAAGLLLGGALTEYSSWRWTLYVNVALALVGVIGTLLTLRHQPRDRAQRLDVVGTIAVTLGLFGLVFGFSSAYERGWADVLTLTCLVLGALLVAAFLVLETRVAHPILPLRILRSQARGGALLVLFLGSVGLFTVSLFLTYYLQENLGFSPIQAGLAFLPQTIAAVAAALASGALLHRFAGSLLVAAGMSAASAGAFVLAAISTTDSYVFIVLPGLVLIGAGLGLSLSVAINLAVLGVRPEDAGVASATANAVQQIGGSIGPALFNTIAGTVLAGYVADRAGGSNVTGTVDERTIEALGAVQSYSVAFLLIGAVLLTGAIIGGVFLEMHRRRSEHPAAVPAIPPTEHPRSGTPTPPSAPSLTP